MRIYSVEECPFNPEDYQTATYKKGNRGTKKRLSYIDVVCAFDIETTRIKEIEQSFMYIWQMCLDKYIVVGRTWDEFLYYMQKLSKLAGKRTLVLYVHNLSYEFEFLQGIYNFTKDDVFSVKPRKVVKCTMYGNIELRCSYIHSNMSLDLFTRKMGCAVRKLTGEFDYSKIRTPKTELSDIEIQYCINDVLSLVEALRIEMEVDGDNIATIPLTSTGYVRRQAKETIRMMPGFRYWINDQLPDYQLYKVLRDAFRGGNTHGSRFYSGRILTNVKSIDRSSSYPDVLVNCKFPIGKFRYREEVPIAQLDREIEYNGKAAVFRIKIKNISLSDEFISCPYISRDKAQFVTGALCDNGRILKADAIELAITDIDYKIIKSQYVWDSAEVFDIHTARYGYLPQCFRDLVKYYYRKKTELKGIPGNEIYYDKFKNMVNSLYGMCAQDPVKQPIEYTQSYEILFKEANNNPEDILTAFNRKAFMSYSVGVWVTAHARRELQELIDIAGTKFVYADTDSVKYVGELDYTEYNNRIRKRAVENGAFAIDKYGNTHYMGVYELDAQYDEFITLGAKKYAYKINGRIAVTCAGVNKKLGGIELERKGGLEAFKPGFTFVDAGGTEAIYNDHVDMYYRIGDEEIHITPNVVIKDSTYTLGLTGEYIQILHNATKLYYLLAHEHIYINNLKEIIENGNFD